MPDTFITGNGYRPFVPQAEYNAELVILPVVPNQHYKQYAPALDPNGDIVFAKTDFTSESSFNAGSWATQSFNSTGAAAGLAIVFGE